MQTVKAKKPGQMDFVVPDFYDIKTLENIVSKKECYTYEDYAKLPEGAPYQLIWGELVIKPSPTSYHQEILSKLGLKMLSFLQDKDSGKLYYAPLDVYLNDKDVYQPDILYISREREGIIGDKKIDGAPDIVIEILSPFTAYYDMRKKFSVCEQHGVKEYWLVDPALKKVEIYENRDKKFKIHNEAEGDGIVSSNVLSGFTFPVNEIF